MRKLSFLCTAIAIGLALPSITNIARADNNLMAGGEVAGVPIGQRSYGSIFNGVSTSQDSCETITTTIGENMAERMKAVLPQDESDNVTSAVEQSMAVSIINQTSSTSLLSISELFTNPFEYIKKAATRLYEAAIDKAKEFLQRAYATAVSNVTSYVNNMYAQKLSQISSKLGRVGGTVLSSTMGQIVPDIQAQVAGCVDLSSSICKQSLSRRIKEHAEETGKRAEKNIETSIKKQTENVKQGIGSTSPNTNQPIFNDDASGSGTGNGGSYNGGSSNGGSYNGGSSGGGSSNGGSSNGGSSGGGSSNGGVALGEAS